MRTISTGFFLSGNRMQFPFVIYKKKLTLIYVCATNIHSINHKATHSKIGKKKA